MKSIKDDDFRKNRIVIDGSKIDIKDFAQIQTDEAIYFQGEKKHEWYMKVFQGKLEYFRGVFIDSKYRNSLTPNSSREGGVELSSTAPSDTYIYSKDQNTYIVADKYKAIIPKFYNDPNCKELLNSYNKTRSKYKKRTLLLKLFCVYEYGELPD